MPVFNPVYDAALNVLTNDCDAIHICSQTPTTYTEAVTTYTLGNKATPTVGAPADRGGGGREVTVSAITDGTVTATGTATHYAMVDVVGTRLLATGALSPSQAVVNAATWTSNSLTVGIPAS